MTAPQHARYAEQWLGRYLSVHAQTGAVQELCSVSKDSVAALRRLPSGDVLLAKDSTCRFVGAPLR